MTSADAVETAKAIQTSKALDLLIKSTAGTRDACFNAAIKWRDVPSIARTHGQQAIPASFGLSFAFFGYCLQKTIERLEYDRERYAEGKLSGVIGTYDVYTNEGIDGQKVEDRVLSNLGVKKSEMAMQTPPREDLAYVMSDLAILCGRLATIASYVKTLKRTEILELSEQPEESSVGSSAMPHKNVHGNPFIEERCISIGRVVRGYALSSLESMSTEDFRDLTASLSDRITLPESFILSDYSCGLVKNVLERVDPVPENIERNLNHSKGVTSSQLVMSKLVGRGMQRQKARELTLRGANLALKNGMSYLDALLDVKEVSELLSKGELKELCNPRSNLGKSREIIDRIVKKYRNSDSGAGH
jgi:adenylosuccinate lyase